MKTQKLSSQGGFSLVGALFAIVIVAITMTALASMMQASQNSYVNLKRKADFEDLQNNLRQALYTHRLCAPGLNDTAVVGGFLKTLPDSLPQALNAMTYGGSGQIFDLQAQKRRYASLDVTGFQITEMVHDGPVMIDNQKFEKYMATFSLQAEGFVKIPGPRQSQALIKAIPVYLDSNKAIVHCGLDVATSPVVTPARARSCPDGQYLQGFAADGSMMCKAIDAARLPASKESDDSKKGSDDGRKRVASSATNSDNDCHHNR